LSLTTRARGLLVSGKNQENQLFTFFWPKYVRKSLQKAKKRFQGIDKNHPIRDIMITVVKSGVKGRVPPEKEGLGVSRPVPV